MKALIFTLSKKPRKTWRGFVLSLLCFTFSSSSVVLCDESVSSPDNNLLRSLKGHSAEVSCLSFSPDGRFLASGSSDKTIRLWDTSTWKTLAVLNAHKGSITALAWSPDSKTLVTSSVDKTVKLWDVEKRRVLHTLVSAQTFCSSLAFSPDGAQLLGSFSNGYLKIWDVKNGQLVRQWIGVSGGTVAAWSPNGLWIACIGVAWFEEVRSPHRPESCLELWDAKTGQLKWESNRDNTRPYTNQEVVTVAFSPDSKTVVTGSESRTGTQYIVDFYGEAKYWDCETGNLQRAVTDERGFSWLAYSTHEDLLVSVGDFYLKLWKASTGEFIRTLAGRYRLTVAALAPNSSLIASSGEDNTGNKNMILLWQMKPN